MFPRLAGQRAEYVLTQLKAFKSNERYAEPGNPMHEVALKLSDQEMEGLANYVAGLD
jgi:cytochrome c553